MKHPRSASRIVPWLVAVAVALPLGLLAWWARVFPADDAYIHLRIAENLVVHGQPSFHPGDRVMGSSSPAWTLLLAVLYALPIPWTVSLIGVEVGLVAASAGKAADLLRRHLGAGPSGQALGGLLVTALLYRSALGWMETPLAILLWLQAVDDWRAGRTRWGLCAGVAAAVRLELVLVGGLMALADLHRRGRPALGAWGAILAGGLPFVLYDLWFFGTVVPAPMAAKSAVYKLSVAESLATALPLHRPRAVAAWLLATAASLGVLLARRPGHGHVPLVAGLLVLATYVAKGSLVFRWYHPLFGVPVLIGALLLGRRRPVAAWATALVLAAPYVRGLAADGAAAWSDRPDAYHGYVAGLRVQKYLEVGARLRAEAPDAVLLTPEIGALGYAFGGRVIDAVGLVSPEAVPHHPLSVPDRRRSTGLGAVPASLVAQTRPDVVVALTSLGEDFLNDPVRAMYTCTEERPVPDDAPEVEVYGSHWLHICWRRSLQARWPGP